MRDGGIIFWQRERYNISRWRRVGPRGCVDTRTINAGETVRGIASRLTGHFGINATLIHSCEIRSTFTDHSLQSRLITSTSSNEESLINR